MSDLDVLVEEQHDTLILLQAMYPRESELVFPTPSALAFLSSPSALPSSGEVYVELNLSLDPSSASADSAVTLEITLCLTTAELKVRLNLGSSALSRSEHENLREVIRPMADEEGSSDYILDTIASLETHFSTIIDGRAAPQVPLAKQEKEEKLERVWFWFPSLSSREKRKDLVVFAHDAGLTGFVLAGKPGLLCVEGDGADVDAYMGRIKSESWSDIPSYQKKVTERLRNTLASSTDRLLPRMVDITDQISHYGTYAHRPEMGEVKAQMQKWGVEEEWAEVIMGPGGGAGG